MSAPTGHEFAGPGAEGSDWEVLARRPVHAPEVAQASRVEFVVLALENAFYAIPIETVREIVRLRPITPVPRVPECVLGVISLRGEITQVVDLRQRLGMPQIDPTRSSRIIVLHHDDATAALLVDSVHDVLRTTEDAIRPAPSGEGDAVAGLCVRDEEFISLLDLDRILDLGRTK